MAFTFHGTGTSFYGQRDFRKDGTYITTEWLVFAYIPIIPLRSLRVGFQGSQGIPILWHRENLAIYEKSAPNWKQVLFVYSYMCSYVLWFGVLLGHANAIDMCLQRWFSRTSSEYILATVVIFGLAAPAALPFVLRWYGRKNVRA
jgi:hypothetical protein